MEKWQIDILDKVAHAGSLPKDISLTKEQIMKQLGVNPAGFLLLTKADLIARNSPDVDVYSITHRWENLKIAGHYHALLTMEHKEIPASPVPAPAPEPEKKPVTETPKAEPVPAVTVKAETTVTTIAATIHADAAPQQAATEHTATPAATATKHESHSQSVTHHATAPAHEKEHHASSPGLTFNPGISEKVPEMDMVSLIALGAATIGIIMVVLSMMHK